MSELEKPPDLSDGDRSTCDSGKQDENVSWNISFKIWTFTEAFILKEPVPFPPERLSGLNMDSM